MLCPAASAAFSIAAHPPSTIKSAKETFLFPSCLLLKSFCIVSNVANTFFSCIGLFTSQLICGAKRIRAPLLPPRLSEPRKVAADAQAVDTSSDIVNPELITVF